MENAIRPSAIGKKNFRLFRTCPLTEALRDRFKRGKKEGIKGHVKKKKKWMRPRAHRVLL
jgi:hypothetical protein